MAIGTGVTEIADSEEEPLTSSPAAVSDAAVDKLSATAGQDAQAVACPHQELAEHTANQASSRTDLLDVDQKKPSTDVEITHYDRPDSQSAHETATNNASACAVETSLPADTSPRASLDAAGVDHQDICTDTDKADGEAGSLRDTGTSPETKHASGLDERAVSQMTQQTHVSQPNNDHHQTQLREHLPIVPECHDVQQDSSSKDTPQGDAIERHNATMKPSQSDPIHLTSSEQEPGQPGGACAISQEDLGATENKPLAAELSHDISHETTVCLTILNL